MKIKYAIEPTEPVMSESEFLKELLLWADREQLKMEIIKAGNMPVVIIDGKKYICKLEPPKRFTGVDFINTSSAYMTFGFKYIYLYEVD